MTTGNQNLTPDPVAQRTANGWFFNWRCGVCMDSGIEVGLLGPERCEYCQAHLDQGSNRIYTAITNLRLKNQPIDEQLLNMARAIVPATAATPVQGEALAQLLECPNRSIKELAARLCEEWSIPAIATRKPPYGYFIARTAGELLEWGRVTRSQAISMLARYCHVFKATYPALAGQQQLDFINTVSAELQEAIR